MRVLTLPRSREADRVAPARSGRDISIVPFFRGTDTAAARYLVSAL
jgi:hypothetical protein